MSAGVDAAPPIVIVERREEVGAAATAEAPAERTVAPPEADGVRDVHPRFRLAWAIPQLIPSPGFVVGDTGVHGSMTWQLTPLLYSWAMDKRLVPFRFFIVEPIVRQSGSVELFVSPEYIGRGAFEDSWGVRGGARAYFPLTERGDGLSWSLGVSAFHFAGETTPALDAGLYTLFGGLGLLASVQPWATDARAQFTLRIRYF